MEELSGGCQDQPQNCINLSSFRRAASSGMLSGRRGQLPHDFRVRIVKKFQGASQPDTKKPKMEYHVIDDHIIFFVQKD